MSRNPENPAYRKLTFPQADKVVQFLKSGICNREGEYAVYAPTWNDEAVARHMAQHNPDMSFISASQVKNLRRPMIGKLRLPNGTPEGGPIGRPRTNASQDDVALIRKNLESLAGTVATLAQQPQLPLESPTGVGGFGLLFKRISRIETRLDRLYTELGLGDQ